MYINHDQNIFVLYNFINSQSHNYSCEFIVLYVLMVMKILLFYYYLCEL